MYVCMYVCVCMCVCVCARACMFEFPLWYYNEYVASSCNSLVLKVLKC